MVRIALALSLVVLISGCCLKEIGIKPEANAVDIKKATLGDISVDVVFKFKDCCPSKEQEELAFKLQANVAEAFLSLVEECKKTGTVDPKRLDAFNKLVDLAHKTITDVILVCAMQHNKVVVAEAVQKELGLPKDTTEGWERVRNVNQQFEAWLAKK